jgi:hypothetical protein
VEDDNSYPVNTPRNGLIDMQREFLGRFSTFSGKMLRVFWEDFQELLERQSNEAFGAFPVRAISFATEVSR